MPRRILIQGLAATALLAISTMTGFAQNKNAGEIRGTVTDASGAAVPEVEVSIVNTLTNITLKQSTNTSGVYVAPFVDAGEYTITFWKEGFQKFVRSGISLQIQTITIDARLQIGSVSQSVVVDAATPLVETETAERGTTVPEVMVQELPNLGRDPYNLTELLPGVSGAATGGGQGLDGSGSGIALNGNASYQSNFQLDGGSMTSPISQNMGATIPVDSVAEFTVRASNFSAEYGSGLSVFTVTTKSGTNQFHGSLFEYDQNDYFKARDYFSTSKKVAPYRWNEFGGTVGGPVKRDKLFFFFSYQRLSQVTYTNFTASYPTASVAGGNLAGNGFPTIYDPNSLALVNGTYQRTPLPGNIIPAARIDPVAAAIESYFPQPNLPGVVNNFNEELRNTSWQNWYSGKGDYNVSANNRITGSYFFSPANSFTPSPMCPLGTGSGKTCITYPVNTYAGQMTDVWTISPTMLNELRFTMNRTAQEVIPGNLGMGYPEKIGLKNAAVDLFPNISISGRLSTGVGGGMSSPLSQTSFIPSDKITWTHGRHIFRFGTEFDRLQANQAWDRYHSGDFTFNGVFTRANALSTSTGTGYADFLFGVPATWQATVIPVTGGRGWSQETFVQDDYKITSHLTLNFGLRHTIQGGWSEVDDRQSNFSPTLTNPANGLPGALTYAGQGWHAIEATKYLVFAPRAGFAWAPKDKWSIRGGFGIFDTMWGENTYGVNIAQGWTVTGFEQTTDNLTPIFTLSQGPPALIVPTNANRTPSLLNGTNITYMPNHVPVSYSPQYSLSIQHELPRAILIDVSYVGNRGMNLGFGRDINQVPENLLGPGNAQTRRPYPQFATITAALFDGYSNYNSARVSVTKRYAHGFSLLANYTFSKTLDTGAGSGWGGTYSAGIWQNAYAPKLNYGLSTLDTPQAFNGAVLWQLPVGKGHALLNHDGVVNAVLGGWQMSGIWQLHSGQPFTPVVGTANLSGALSGTWLPNRTGNGALSDPTPNMWFNTGAFAIPAAYTFGDSGRDVVLGPGFQRVNMSMARNFPIPIFGEKTNLQFRVDAHNATNTPQFGQPNASIGNGGVGTIRSTAGQRNIQLGARLTF
jgi:hypothetical protein